MQGLLSDNTRLDQAPSAKPPRGSLCAPHETPRGRGVFTRGEINEGGGMGMQVGWDQGFE